MNSDGADRSSEESQQGGKKFVEHWDDDSPGSPADTVVMMHGDGLPVSTEIARLLALTGLALVAVTVIWYV